jgi:PIN domain
MKTAPPRAPRRLYLDTSAYLCVLLGEDGADAIARLTAGAELLSSVLLVLETHRNLVRLAREGAIKPSEYKACLERLHQDQDRFLLRDLTPDLCTSAALPAVSTPRTLDLAHLRTALWFHADTPLDRFVTLDDRQAEAARELGLPA